MAKEKKSPIDDTSHHSSDLKVKGNDAFKSGDYPAAIGYYTAAILADKSDPTFPLNRAAAYLKLGKYEDTIRDCSTVLTLDASNVKALFRRGQAMVGLNRLSEAQKDFDQVLKLDPTNQSAKQESTKVAEQIGKEGSQSRLAGLTPAPGPTPPSTERRRRRIPIEIVEPNDTAPKSDDKSSDPRSSSQPPVPTELTFKDARQARAAAKPSRTGGGIFRSTGDHSIFNTDRAGTPTTTPSRELNPSPIRSPSPAVKSSPDEMPNLPMTLFDFIKALRSSRSAEERWDLICTLPPSGLPALFKISLEPPVLTLILETFLDALNQSAKAGDRVREYMDAFANVPRFSTVVLLLNDREKDIARGVWEKLGVDHTSSAWRI